MTLRNTIFALTFVAALAGAFFIAHTHPDNRPSEVPENQVKGQELSATGTAAKPSSSKSEYRKENFSKHLALTNANIIWFTNYYRSENGLKPLIQNQALSRSSAAKAADMLGNQYFDHVRPGPDKVGFDRFIDNQRYAFVKIGENLAMGDFSTSYEVVKAWMNSPSHKRNILDPQYFEIGVSISYGTMDGQDVGIMVQHFGNPRKNCPVVDESAKGIIDDLRARVGAAQKLISSKQPGISQEGTILTDSEYDAAVKEYNGLVESYNALVKEMGDLVAKYNSQVKAVDSCIRK